MILRADHVTFAYRDGEPVLHDASLEVRPGIVTGLFGPNGSGKTTLLRCLNGSLRPSSGRVLLGEALLAGMSHRQVASHIAVVPQDTPSDVPLTVKQMVMLGRYAHANLWGEESLQDTRIAEACMERLGVAALAHRPFGQLSGGERQRTIIARALAQQGRVVLMDEPNAHLDLPHQLEVYRLARSLAAEGQAVLMICHDLLIAPLMVDVAVVMQGGRIVACGSPRQVLTPSLLREVFGTTADITWNDRGCVSAQFAANARANAVPAPRN
jgi:iron complex transport system ATP-binding protein